MNISNEGKEQFETIGQKLIDWLRAHAHPHCTIIIDCNSAGFAYEDTQNVLE